MMCQLFHLSPSELCAPGEIAPQLPVAEGGIGGVIALHLTVIGEVVLVVGQELGLLEKQRLCRLMGIAADFSKEISRLISS